jgi:hypothetical protein
LDEIYCLEWISSARSSTPQLLWMNGGRFVLAGFERVVRTGVEIDFVQSWLCIVETEQ